MNLADNQFLKIKNFDRVISFEIFEIPAEKWKRPKRWQVSIAKSEIVNRHKRESKIKRINEALRTVEDGINGVW